MFDISWGEIGLVVVVATVMLGPEELPAVIRAIKKARTHWDHLKGECTRVWDTLEKETSLAETKKDLNTITSELNQNIRTIVDDNGKEWPAYSVEEVEADIAATKQAAATEEKEKEGKEALEKEKKETKME